MAFSSNLGKMPVISDRNYWNFLPDVTGQTEYRRGYVPRDYDAIPLGSLPFAATLPRDFYIPEVEWKERIEEKARKKAGLIQLADMFGLTVLDQNGTNYCWANGPVRCAELTRLKQGQGVVRLSPASVAAPATNYRNVGGWGDQALEFIVKNGIAPQSLWPANAINRQYDNAESKEARQLFMVPEWWDAPRGDFEALVSLVLQDIPVALGLDWWGHLICVVEAAVDARGQIVVVIDNSWGTRWGDNGRGILEYNKALGDMVCIRAMTPSRKTVENSPTVAC